MSDTVKSTAARSTLLKWIFIVLQIVLLAGIAISYYAVGWFGRDVLLKTKPVDPRDLLYGDYVTLSYDIDQLTPSIWKESSAAEKGQTIYVVLKAGSDGYAAPLAAYRTKPQVQPDEIVLKGRVEYSWDESIRVDYGIGKYYVPENTGKELEQKAGQLAVKVKVAPWGQGKIETLEERE